MDLNQVNTILVIEIKLLLSEKVKCILKQIKLINYLNINTSSNQPANILFILDFSLFRHFILYVKVSKFFI